MYFSTPPSPPEPDVVISPTSHDFGAVVVGSSRAASLWVTNRGALELEVTDAVATGPEYTVVSPSLPFTVLRGATRELVVSFAPTAPGPTFASLEVASTDPDTPLLSLPLAGSGTAAPVIELHINAGGGAYTDSLGNEFAADKPFSAGDLGYIEGRPGGWSGGIGGTIDDPLYQTARGGTSFSYVFDGLREGSYSLTLHFMEPFNATPPRLFDFRAEGILILDDFDVAATAGGTFQAITETFSVYVVDGRLDVDFAGVSRVAIVGAISVVAE